MVTAAVILITLLFLIGYVMVARQTYAHVMRRNLNDRIVRNRLLYPRLFAKDGPTPRGYDDSDRGAAHLDSMLAALFWPAFLACRVVVHVLSRGLDLTPPIERAERDAAELAALRRQAKDLGLPMPGDGIR